MAALSSYLSKQLLDWIRNPDRMRLPPELQKPQPKMHSPGSPLNPPTLGIPGDPPDLRKQIRQALDTFPMWYSIVDELAVELTPRQHMLTRIKITEHDEETTVEFTLVKPLDLGPMSKGAMAAGILMADHNGHKLVAPLDNKRELAIGDSMRISTFSLNIPTLWKYS